MKNKLTKLICVGVMLIMSIGVLCACNDGITKQGTFDNIYNAEIYDRALNYMNQEYILDHLVSDAIFDGNDTDIIGGDSLPSNYSYIISDKSEFEKAFKNFPVDVDFEERVICVHFFSCIVNGRDYEIKDITKKDSKLIIEIKSIIPNVNYVPIDGTPPIMRCIVIVMDKIEMTEVVFVEQ